MLLTTRYLNRTPILAGKIRHPIWAFSTPWTFKNNVIRRPVHYKIFLVRQCSVLFSRPVLGSQCIQQSLTHTPRQRQNPNRCYHQSKRPSHLYSISCWNVLRRLRRHGYCCRTPFRWDLSPPSAFAVRSASFGLVSGVDVYDCVCVLNTQAAVDAYQKSEMRLGGAATFAAGPIGGTAKTNVVDVKPVCVYTKSKGAYGGVTLDSTVIKELPKANADFYGAHVATAEILRGEVKPRDEATKWPAGAKQLVDVLRMVENRID